MKYILDLSKLKPCDIALTKETTAQSKAVQLGTWSKYSHAILFVENGSYIHSDALGVRAGNPQRLIFNDRSSVKVLRYKNNLTRNQTQMIIQYSRIQVGKSYSIYDAVSAKLTSLRRHDSNRQFCSRLVAEAYSNAQIALVEGSNDCTPKDLLKSNVLEEVKDSIKVANSTEIEFANSPDPSKSQALMVQEIFTQVREITQSDIQTSEQIIDFLIKNKNFDEVITDVFRVHGYKSMLEVDRNRNPWRYSTDAFLKKFPVKEHFSRARSEIAHAKLQLDKRLFQLVNLKEFNLAHNFDFVDLMIEIECEMIALFEKSIETHTEVLAKIQH